MILWLCFVVVDFGLKQGVTWLRLALKLCEIRSAPPSLVL